MLAWIQFKTTCHLLMAKKLRDRNLLRWMFLYHRANLSNMTHMTQSIYKQNDAKVVVIDPSVKCARWLRNTIVKIVNRQTENDCLTGRRSLVFLTTTQTNIHHSATCLIVNNNCDLFCSSREQYNENKNVVGSPKKDWSSILQIFLLYFLRLVCVYPLLTMTERYYYYDVFIKRKILVESVWWKVVPSVWRTVNDVSIQTLLLRGKSGEFVSIWKNQISSFVVCVLKLQELPLKVLISLRLRADTDTVSAWLSFYFADRWIAKKVCGADGSFEVIFWYSTIL